MLVHQIPGSISRRGHTHPRLERIGGTSSHKLCGLQNRQQTVGKARRCDGEKPASQALGGGGVSAGDQNLLFQWGAEVPTSWTP